MAIITLMAYLVVLMVAVISDERHRRYAARVWFICLPMLLMLTVLLFQPAR